VNRFVLNYETLGYEPTKQPKLPIVTTAKEAGSLKNRLPILLKDQSKAGELIRKHFASLFAYVSQRVQKSRMCSTLSMML
jgi:3-hydroxyacyl-CoA dehydrogenase